MLQHSQYAIPIGIVLVCAILVFVFGFKNAEQPPFAQLTSGSDVDRKPAGKKRNKIKEKVTTERASPAKKVAPVKAAAVKKAPAKAEEPRVELKERKHEENKPVVPKKEKIIAPKSGKENKVELAKNRKNLKNHSSEKPVDFDDGDWEPAYSRKEKKNKKKDDEAPPKRSKKEGKKTAELISGVNRNEKEQGKPEVKDKVAKDTENKELKEKDKKESVLAAVADADAEPAGDMFGYKEEKEELGKIEKLEKQDKTEKSEKSEKSEKPEKPEKIEGKKSSKEKKTKKPATIEVIPQTSEPPSPEKPEEVEDKLAEEEKKAKSETAEGRKIEQVKQNNSVVFDELGDVWTEAKPQKKSKKKARKDN